MPAASLSSSVSWTFYFAAALALVAVCSPILTGTKEYSCWDSAARTGLGAAEVLDGLRPGMAVVFSFHSPSAADRIALEGRSLTLIWCGRSLSFRSAWWLPHRILDPGQSYIVKLAGRLVDVSRFV